MDLYELLQVSRNASREVIEKAYKTLAAKYHPDVVQYEFRERAEEYMKHLNYARSVLTDDNLRTQYDMELTRNENPVETNEELNSLGQIIHKIPNWLRWILALPVSILVYLLIYLISTWSLRMYTGVSSTYINGLIQAVISIPVVIFTFNEIVPKYKTVISSVLCILIGLIYMLAAYFSISYGEYLNGSFIFTILVYSLVIISAVITIKTVSKANKE